LPEVGQRKLRDCPDDPAHAERLIRLRGSGELVPRFVPSPSRFFYFFKK
jgi:hypothetical protein